jgi:hypothetical protein
MSLKAQIDPNTVIVGDFSTPLSPIDRSFRQKVNKETLELYDLTNVYRVFHPITTQYIFFSAAHELSPK